jgi:V/A-type H+-transporting ATPase subunit A
MAKRIGCITRINGNMVTVEFTDFAVQNEVAYIIHGEERLKSEVIRVRGKNAELQVYESTSGLKVGEEVEFTSDLLSVELGPGLLGQIFDGLQNPLPHLAEKCGFFLKRGVYFEALPDEAKWEFTPSAKKGDKVRAGDKLGTVPEKIFKHYIMVPFGLGGILEVVNKRKNPQSLPSADMARKSSYQGIQRETETAGAACHQNASYRFALSGCARRHILHTGAFRIRKDGSSAVDKPARRG